MNLTPGEKAVLGQIRVLYYNAAKRDQEVKALLNQCSRDGDTHRSDSQIQCRAL